MKIRSIRSAGRSAALGGLAVASALALALTSCSGGGSPLSTQDSSADSTGGTVKIGSADFAESQVIAQIYAGALKSAGVSVDTSKQAIGSREVYLKALGDGSIDLIPDYTGNLLQAVNSSNTATSKDDINKALPEALASKNLAILNPSSAEDKDSIVVTKATAEKYNLNSLDDLAKVCGKIKLMAPPEFKDRSYGLPGLKKNYNCVPAEFQGNTSEPLTVTALLKDDVQAADIFSTSPAISDNSLKVLSDPKNNILANQVVPLYTKGKLSSKAQEVLNKVSSQLSTDDLVKLNRLMLGDQKLDPQEAAAQWLKEKGYAQ